MVHWCKMLIKTMISFFFLSENRLCVSIWEKIELKREPIKTYTSMQPKYVVFELDDIRVSSYLNAR